MFRAPGLEKLARGRYKTNARKPNWFLGHSMSVRLNEMLKILSESSEPMTKKEITMAMGVEQKIIDQIISHDTRMNYNRICHCGWRGQFRLYSVQK